MRDIALGQYYPVSSPVHSLDPRLKLVLCIAFIVMLLGFVETFFAYGVVVAFLLFLIFFSRVPLRTVIRSLKPVLFIILFTFALTVLFYGGGGRVIFQFGIIQIYLEGVLQSVKMLLRLILLISGTALLTLTTTPTALTDALEWLLKPLSLIRLPVHEFAIIMSLTLRMIPAIAEETDKIVCAQKARCAEFESGNLIKRAKSLLPVLVPLFVSGIRRAEEIADAIDSRCYSGAKGRTRMHKLCFAVRDFAALVVFSAVFFAVLTIRYGYFGLRVGGLI